MTGTQTAGHRWGKVYSDKLAAARAFIRAAKARGSVTILGGGWWQIDGWNRPVQGYGAVAKRLIKRGRLRQLPDGNWTLEP